MSVGVDFDFAKWIAVRRGSLEQQQREGATYAFAGERAFRRTLMLARPVTMALEATTRLWRDVARTELLGTAVKVTDEQYPRVYKAAKAAGAALRVRVPAVFAAPAGSIKVKVLGAPEDAPHLDRPAPGDRRAARRLGPGRRDRARARSHSERPHLLRDRAALPHQRRGVLCSLGRPARDHDAAGVVAARRDHLRSRRCCSRSATLDKALQALVTLRARHAMPPQAPRSAPTTICAPSPTRRGSPGGASAKLRSSCSASRPDVAKRIQALRLFAGSALYAQAIGQDPIGRQADPGRGRRSRSARPHQR